MATFNPNNIQQLLATNDFLGVANYYEQFPIKDKTKRIEVNQYIKELKRYGGIANAILSQNIDENNRNKIAFSMQRKTGQYGDNPYAKQVLNYINNIGSINNKRASYFDYTFINEKEYNKFKEASGLNFGGKNDDNPLMPYRYTNNGRPVVRIYKSAFADSDLFNNVSKALIAISNNIYKPVNPYNRMAYDNTDNATYTAFGINPYNRITTQQNNNIIDTSIFTSTAYDDKGNIITTQYGILDNQIKAYNLITDADNAIKEIFDKSYEKVVPSELMVSGFMCQAQEQITKLAMSGGIDTTTANFQLGRIKDYYDNMLNSISLSNYEVYSTDINGKTQNLSAISDDLKSDYTNMLRAAIRENRVTYVSGTSGGRVGTAITIAPKLDSDGKPIGNYAGGIQLFVPGLFEEDARKLINTNPEAKAMVERAEHIAFQHAYNLVGGGRFENFTNDGATYTDDTGSYFVPTKELNESLIYNEFVNGSIDTLQENIYDNPNMSAADIEKTATEYAQTVYYYLNNITTKEQMDSDETKQGVKSITQLLLKSVVQNNDNQL